MRNLLLLLLAAASVLAACESMQQAGAPTAAGDLDPGGRGKTRVERVVDGDTVVLDDIGKSRLIGIDTPEVYGGTVECYGPQASAFAKRVLTPGRRVRYEIGADPRDRYDRALIYLWLDDGRFFNAMLLRRGYATPLAIEPNTDRADLFERMARRAERRGVGMWSAGCSDK
jgi:micrococcal nuclease